MILPAHSALDKINESYKLDASIRGRFIVDAVQVEMLVSYIIAEHFFPNSKAKRDSFFSLILNRSDFTFSMKFKIFMEIMQLKHKTLFTQHQKNLKKIKHMMELRNKLAHCYFGLNDAQLVAKDTIRLTYYKKGNAEKLDLSKSKMEEESRECLNIVISLLGIRDKIGRK